MESLLIREDNCKALIRLQKTYSGKVDLIYIDIPYNTGNTFNSCEGGGKTISKVHNSNVAYNDNMPFEEYLSYIKHTLELARPLLSEKGSVYLHIDCKVGHYIKVIMDEVFGFSSFKNDITRIKSNPKNFQRRAWSNQKDLILFYAVGNDYIWNSVKTPMTENDKKRYNKHDEKGWYTTVPCHAPGETLNGRTGEAWNGLLPPAGRHWRVPPQKLDELNENGLIEWSKNGNPRIKNYFSDKKGKAIQDVWIFKDPQKPTYPTEKNLDMLELIVKQSSNPKSIVLDFFCGSGTTLLAAENNERFFIGIDNSLEAIKACKKKLKKGSYKYVSRLAGIPDYSE